MASGLTRRNLSGAMCGASSGGLSRASSGKSSWLFCWLFCWLFHWLFRRRFRWRYSWSSSKKKKEQMQGQNNQLDILQGVNWSTHDWAASKWISPFRWEQSGNQRSIYANKNTRGKTINYSCTSFKSFTIVQGAKLTAQVLGSMLDSMLDSK